MARLSKIQCQINLGRSLAISPKIVKKTVERILALFKIKEADISVAFIDHGEIRKLNKTYRGKNSATDVLSFPYYHKKGYLSGEIIISWPQVKKNAAKEKILPFSELNKVLIHSLLHLIGYDHQKEAETVLMRKKEREIISKIN